MVGRYTNDSYINQNATMPTVDPANVSGGIITPYIYEVGQNLWQVWRQHYDANVRRNRYFSGHEAIKDFGYSVPDRVLYMSRTMLAWPQKAVTSLSDMSVLEGLDVPDADTYNVRALFDSADLLSRVPEAIVSAYIHGCAFWTVSQNGIYPHPAEWCAAIWDDREQRVAQLLTINAKDSDGNVTDFTLWLPGKTVEYVRLSAPLSGWAANISVTHLPFPPVAYFSYDPQLDKPFGRSRISRTLMALTDMGVRTLVRMEATAEYYSAPRIWFLGLDKSKWPADKWRSSLAAINGITPNKNGQNPEIHQVSQASMEPHAAMLESIARQAAAETGLLPEDFGVNLANPTSAEAMSVAELKMSRTADRQNRLFGQQIKQLLTLQVMFAHGLTYNAAQDALKDVSCVWHSTRVSTDGARADFYQKVASTNSDWADSDVALRHLGMTEDEIRSYRIYQQSHAADTLLSQIRLSALQQPAASNNTTTAPATTQAPTESQRSADTRSAQSAQNTTGTANNANA